MICLTTREGPHDAEFLLRVRQLRRRERERLPLNSCQIINPSHNRDPMGAVRQLTMAELEAGLDEIRKSPSDSGVLRLIVRRPVSGRREELQQGTIDVASG